MVKIVVASPNLTQRLLFYPGLGPTMLDNIGRVKSTKLKAQIFFISLESMRFNLYLSFNIPVHSFFLHLET
jgi:hypothetical protein